MYTYLNVLKKSIKTDSNGQPKNAVNLGDDLSWRLSILHSLSQEVPSFFYKYEDISHRLLWRIFLQKTVEIYQFQI